MKSLTFVIPLVALIFSTLTWAAPTPVNFTCIPDAVAGPAFDIVILPNLARTSLEAVVRSRTNPKQGLFEKNVTQTVNNETRESFEGLGFKLVINKNQIVELYRRKMMKGYVSIPGIHAGPVLCE